MKALENYGRVTLVHLLAKDTLIFFFLEHTNLHALNLTLFPRYTKNELLCLSLRVVVLLNI